MLNIKKIKTALAESKFLSQIIYFPEIDSTNVYAKSVNSDGGTLILTDNQKKGLGRLDRTWESEKEKNLTFTIKKHFYSDSENIQSVNFYFSYFLLACIKDIIAKNNIPGNIFPETSIKWPNDILINSRKVSGILIENNYSNKEFIIGVGININQVNFPAEYAEKTTSVKNCINKEIDCTQVLIDLLNIYESNLYLLEEHKYDLIFNLWKESTALINKHIEFSDGKNNVKQGKIIDLMNDGGIKIAQNGRIFTYYSGDIKILKEHLAETHK